MWFTILSWTVVTIAALLWYLKQRNKVFEELGIPGPKPLLLFGNFLDIVKRQEHVLMRNWAKTYGKVFGYYEGATPILMVSDVDMIQDICVKNFGKAIPGHRPPSHITQEDQEKGDNEYVSMAEAIGSKWKRLRTIASPIFTGAKLKEVEPTIREKIGIFLEKIGEKAAAGKEFDANIMCEAMTIDVIAQVAFDVSIDCQNNHNDPFQVRAKQAIMMTGRGSDILNKVFVLFPELRFIWKHVVTFLVKYVIDDPFNKLRAIAQAVIDQYQREIKNNGKTVSTKNFIHTIMESEMPAGQLDDLKKADSEAKFEKKMSSNEITQQMVLFLLAGSTTTSTSMSMMIYELARNPEVQQKLYDEILKAAGGDPNKALTYDQVKDLYYLDWAFKETLRMHCIAANANDRKAKESCVIGGITVPAGMEIKINQWALHHDPILWGEDVDVFRPERFSEPLKHPMQWVPFGAGPRVCLGMKFAYMESKLAMVALLQRYRLVACQKTMEPLQLTAQLTLEIPGGIWIKVEKR